ncbi:MAG: MBL fold metallo-hydrolase [Eubacteriaceae bacterium]|nr:MBL fold metallo-hydrolase [Eubacteriaceae bacterium]
MKIHHISHSGFVIEKDDTALIFDCIIWPDSIDFQGKKVVFFSSHGHRDHFDEKTAVAFEKYDCLYILSSDIKTDLSNSKIHFVEPYQKLILEGFSLETFGSTDRGVSFLVNHSGTSFFHSGDLNWWHWIRMSPEELEVEARDFKKVIDKIAGNSIDYAFVPVDPRLKEFGYLAGNYFIEKLKPKFFIPMHSFGEYSYFIDLPEKLNLGNSILLNCSRTNQLIYNI